MGKAGFRHLFLGARIWVLKEQWNQAGCGLYASASLKLILWRASCGGEAFLALWWRCALQSVDGPRFSSRLSDFSKYDAL